MTQAHRTPAGGSAIDRERPISFTFDGVAYAGYEGDTLASALLANGVRLVGRSYKYHRPRGIVAAGPEEPNALVGVQRGPGRFTPNLRATEVELYDGLVATSQNRWPTLRFDVGAINDVLAPLIGAGFYYKTLMGPDWFGPNWAWKRVYEPIIRRAAGLGSAPREPDPDRYHRAFAHCDVLIVGAGPAGLAAARAAAESGADVVVCDENPLPGGSLGAETRATIDGQPASQWLAETLDGLRRAPNVRLMPRTQAFGYYAQNLVGLSERLAEPGLLADPKPPRERLWRMRAGEVVLATGAIERPLIFADNDRPGIMLAGAARPYLNLHGVKVGERVVVVTAHDEAYRAALDLHEAGVAVELIADLRDEAAGPLPQAARAAGLRVAVKAAVHAVEGRLLIIGVRLSAHPGGMRRIACDALLMSGGWTPSVSLFSQSRGRLAFDEAAQLFRPGASVQRERSAGACNATFALADALAEGEAAGRAAAEAAGSAASGARAYAVEGAPAAMGGALGAPLHVLGDRAIKAFVDFQNDVCVKDIELAVQEGLRSIEHVKRYTTTGMATDQGKLSNMNALAIAAAVQAKPIPAVGLTTFRPPTTPVTFGAFAGPARDALFDPIRKTPMHGWAAAQGAVFEDVSLWKRAWYFQRAGETMAEAVQRECRTTRSAVGLFDASTLGKIEVVGRDAAVFLERMYVNAFARLAVGRCRYGLMLTETGFVLDDGVVARLAADRFHVTTTTGGAARVLAHMEDYLQTEFAGLEVWLTSTTEHWATIAVQGPKARQTIAPLLDGVDLSNAAFPHMSVRDARVLGVPARLMRVSFTGELGYEINVGSAYGLEVWKAVFAAVEKQGGCAYGTEATHVLRAEKGYVIVGQETDGTVTPADLGLDWAIGKAKADFVGKRSLMLPELAREGRKQLVGLMTEDPALVLEEGAQVTASAAPPVGSRALGHVTSSYLSPAAGRSIALALVAGGRARIGQRVHVSTPAGRAAPATLAQPCAYDPEGARLNV